MIYSQLPENNFMLFETNVVLQGFIGCIPTWLKMTELDDSLSCNPIGRYISYGELNERKFWKYNLKATLNKSINL